MTLYSRVEIVQPSNVHQALEWMHEAAEQGQPLRPMAGCTDIMVDANFNKLKWRRFINLWGLRFALGELEWALEGAVEPDSLQIGALATYGDLMADARACIELPTLATAASLVGATQIQARGTFAGNVENGSPAADAVPVLMAMDARVRLANLKGIREIPLDQYYTGYRQTQRGADEMITALILPHQDVGPRGHFFRKVGTRAFQAITKVGLAARIHWQGDSICEARIVAVSMAPMITRCPHIERALVGMNDLNDDTRDILRNAQEQDLAPISDVRSSDHYRNEVFFRLVCQAVLETRPDAAS